MKPGDYGTHFFQNVQVTRGGPFDLNGGFKEEEVTW
jgi:hypothetical protein